MAMNPATAVSLSTVRIESSSEAGKSVGTGYFYNIETPAAESGFVNVTPLIVTNKHVVCGSKLIKVTLDVAKSGSHINEDGSVDWQERHTFELDPLGGSILMHPDDEVDLCVIRMGQILGRIAEGYTPKNHFLDKRWRLGVDDFPHIRPIESVVMVGYPNGMWDKHNNKPIVRKGMTATHCLTRWDNNRYFVIDCACFPGSSGSPVFLYEDGIYRVGGDKYAPGTGAKLIGTLWGGPTYSNKGKLIPKPVPSLLAADADAIPVIEVMMNLGFVIHADALDDFIPIISRLIENNQ